MIAVGVLIPNNISGEHNEIMNIMISSNNEYYYYQSELTDDGVEEGTYSTGVIIDDDNLPEEIERINIDLESINFV